MTDDDTNDLGHYLRAHREQAGLAIRQLASMVGVDHGYLVRLESGQKRNPSAELLHKIAGVLELDPSEVLGFIGVTPADSLPSPRVYFRKKYGMSDADARRAAQLIEQYTHKDKPQIRKGGDP